MLHFVRLWDVDEREKARNDIHNSDQPTCRFLILFLSFVCSVFRFGAHGGAPGSSTAVQSHTLKKETQTSNQTQNMTQPTYYDCCSLSSEKRQGYEHT